LQTDKKGNVVKKGDGFLVRKSERGKPKVAIDKIEQGILKDGQNFKTGNNLVKVGGKGQPTENGLELFVLKLSDYVGREIGGAYFGGEKTTHVSIGMYKNNSLKEAKSLGHVLGLQQGLNLTGFFHTHPSLGIADSDRLRASGQDKSARDNDLKTDPNLQFFILAAPVNYGDIYPKKIDYTQEN
jgi:hypothetical protein